MRAVTCQTGDESLGSVRLRSWSMEQIRRGGGPPESVQVTASRHGLGVDSSRRASGAVGSSISAAGSPVPSCSRAVARLWSREGGTWATDNRPLHPVRFATRCAGRPGKERRALDRGRVRVQPELPRTFYRADTLSRRRMSITSGRGQAVWPRRARAPGLSVLVPGDVLDRRKPLCGARSMASPCWGGHGSTAVVALPMPSTLRACPSGEGGPGRQGARVPPAIPATAWARLVVMGAEVAVGAAVWSVTRAM